MSRDLDQNMSTIESLEQLIAYFRSGEKSLSDRAFGTEHEKFVFKKEDGKLLSFEEPGGYADLFEKLVRDHGWEASYDQGHIVALVKNGAAITLEPGGQLELSGRITKTVFETEQEFDAHISELRELTGDHLSMVSFGANPFDDLEDVPWMPKSRYGIMRRYLPTRGDLAHWMMKMTCTVQGNYDYTSEKDAVDILRTSLIISPMVSAMFANSPMRFGKASGMHTFRCHIWTRTDPDRTGFPDFMFGTDWGYQEYLNYVIDIPMFFIRRGNDYIEMTGLTFKEFMDQGFEGYVATMGDFELHLSTVFPEVRMKTYIEVRGADAGSREMILALPALWKGILYSDNEARIAARDLMGDVGKNPEQLRHCFAQVHEHGIHAKTPCGDFLQLAKELVAISKKGLAQIALREGHESEEPFLDVLTQQLDRGRDPADDVIDAFARLNGDRMKIVEEFSF